MSEAVGILEGCVVLDGFIDREVTVNLYTVDRTAIGIASSILLLIYFCFSANFILSITITFMDVTLYTRH